MKSIWNQIYVACKERFWRLTK